MCFYINSKFICFLLGLMFLNGCKLSQKTNETIRVDSESEGRLSATISGMQFGARDSSLRMWYFISDSSFYFHPDEGLWGQSGKVAYSERKDAEIGAGSLSMHYDSLGTAQSALKTEKELKWKSQGQGPWLWLLLIPLLVLACWGYRKFY